MKNKFVLFLLLPLLSGGCKGAYFDPGLLDAPGSDGLTSSPPVTGGSGSMRDLVGTWLHDTWHDASNDYRATRCYVRFSATSLISSQIAGQFDFSYNVWDGIDGYESGFISSYNGSTVYIYSYSWLGSSGITSFRVSVSGDKITVSGWSGYASNNFDLSKFNGTYTRGNP